MMGWTQSPVNYHAYIYTWIINKTLDNRKITCQWLIISHVNVNAWMGIKKKHTIKSVMFSMPSDLTSLTNGYNIRFPSKKIVCHRPSRDKVLVVLVLVAWDDREEGRFDHHLSLWLRYDNNKSYIKLPIMCSGGMEYIVSMFSPFKSIVDI